METRLFVAVAVAVAVADNISKLLGDGDDPRKNRSFDAKTRLEDEMSSKGMTKI